MWSLRTFLSLPGYRLMNFIPMQVQNYFLHAPRQLIMNGWFSQEPNSRPPHLAWEFVGGFFKDAQDFGRLDAGSRAGFTSPRPPSPPWTSVSQFPLFLYDVWPWETWTGWSKLVDQNWLERNLSALLLRTLVVGRRQQSESIEVALDMEKGGLMKRFDIMIGRCHYYL